MTLRTQRVGARTKRTNSGAILVDVLVALAIIAVAIPMGIRLAGSATHVSARAAGRIHEAIELRNDNALHTFQRVSQD